MIFVFITLEIKNLLKVGLVLLAVAVLAASASFAFPQNVVSVMGPYGTRTLLIDAGHGGVDGGAVSSAGAKESDINLAIALKMASLCELMGLEHALTRTDSEGCLNSAPYSEHDDLVARADMANSIADCVLISVHQNKYPSDVVRGAEVMYAETPQSRELGLITQDNMVSALDPDNRRVARQAPGELLLTSSVNCPAILVECGFMSNPQEADKLSDDVYQAKIALTLIASYTQFCSHQL